MRVPRERRMAELPVISQPMSDWEAVVVYDKGMGVRKV